MVFKDKYGPVALVAGASEGLGAAWSHALAKRGLNLVLVARRKELLEKFGAELSHQYGITVTPVACDLADDNVLEQITSAIGQTRINFLVYNAALSYIAPLMDNKIGDHLKLAKVNMLAPISLVHHFGGQMCADGGGGVVLMSSLAGFQGTGFLATYAASKAFNRVLAEGLWYEWRDKGVDVIGCCAGATETPNYINTKPKTLNFFAPKAQTPGEVVEECLQKMGKTPSFITGSGNRLASFFMNKLFSRKMAVNTISEATGKMYGLK